MNRKPEAPQTPDEVRYYLCLQECVSLNVIPWFSFRKTEKLIFTEHLNLHILRYWRPSFYMFLFFYLFFSFCFHVEHRSEMESCICKGSHIGIEKKFSTLLKAISIKMSFLDNPKLDFFFCFSHSAIAHIQFDPHPYLRGVRTTWWVIEFILRVSRWKPNIWKAGKLVFWPFPPLA